MLKAVLFLALLPAVFTQPEDQPPAESTPSKAAEAAVGFQWKPALLQSGIFFGVQHVGRMAQAKTRRELAGPFWSDYFESASNIHTWRDGDGIPTNYLGHPVMVQLPATFRCSAILPGSGSNSKSYRSNTGRAV